MDGDGDFRREAAAAAEAFFALSPPLEGEEEVRRSLQAFVAGNTSPVGGAAKRPVVCVTSGGTTVPLERRCVRFIDNFSAGNRGAASTEYFLQAGYSVVFLHRRGSIRPFCRGLPESPVLSCLEVERGSRPGDMRLSARDEFREDLVRAVKETQQALEDKRLLLVPFTTLFQYLQLLRLISLELNDFRAQAMFYLAAAVSDYYVPWESMVEHKIQSSTGPLDIQLAQVPKMLFVLRSQWAPHAFVVSFKLETDSDLLLSKARAARERYGVHAVVANELLTRARKVVLLSNQGEDVLTVEGHSASLPQDIEAIIIDRLSEMHREHRTEERA